MESLNTVVAEITQVLTAVIALYFFVGLVVNLAQAQLAGGTGDTMGYARALQQTITMVILLAFAGSAPAIGALVKGFFTGAPVQNSEQAVYVWKTAALFIVDVTVGGVIMYTAVASVWSTVSIQAGTALGSSSMVSTAINRVVKLVLGAIATILAVSIANWIIGLIF